MLSLNTEQFPDNASEQNSILYNEILLKFNFNISDINVLLHLASEFIDYHAQEELDADENYQGFNNIIELYHSLKEKPITSGSSLKLEFEKALTQDMSLSQNDINRGWHQILAMCIKSPELKINNEEFVCAIKDLFESATATWEMVMRYDTNGNAFERKELVYDIDRTSINELFIHFLDNLNQSKETEKAKAIHTFIHITKNMIRNNSPIKQPLQNIKILSQFTALLCEALNLNNLSFINQDIFLSQICASWLEISEFKNDFVQKYNLTQINNILLIINAFIASDTPQIIKLNGKKELLDFLTINLAPIFSKKINEDILIDTTQCLISQIKTTYPIEDIDISIALGQLLRVSFAHSQLFSSEHKAITKFRHSMLAKYNKSEKDTQKLKKQTSKSVIKLTKEISESFRKMMVKITLTDPDVAQAIHTFLAIGRSVALADNEKIKPKDSFDGFQFVAFAGLGAALFNALKFHKKIDPDNLTNEMYLFTAVVTQLLHSKKFDVPFNREDYLEEKKEVKLEVLKKLSKLHLTGTSSSLDKTVLDVENQSNFQCRISCPQYLNAKASKIITSSKYKSELSSAGRSQSEVSKELWELKESVLKKNIAHKYLN